LKYVIGIEYVFAFLPTGTMWQVGSEIAGDDSRVLFDRNFLTVGDSTAA